MRHLVLLTALALAPAALAQVPIELAQVDSELTDAEFGFAVAAVPGEGVLVGAPDANSTGRAYLFSADGTLIHTLASGNPEGGGNFGFAVASVPDADGDGRADLVVGASGETVSGFAGAGRAYLFSSATGARIRTYEPPLVGGNRQTNGLYGRAVAGIEDVNGDGRGDVIVGAPGLSYEIDGGMVTGAGRAFVVSGPNGALLATLEPIAVDPGGGGDNFGSAMARVPDVDGDGLDDVAVSAVSTQPTAGVTLFSSATWDALRRIAAVQDGDLFGFRVAGVTDLDGDGRGDLIVGAINTDVDGISVGAAYVVSGASGTVLRTLFAPAPLTAAAAFGSSVAAVETGDGTVNVLVGEPDRSSFVGVGGRVFVFDAASGTLLRTLTSPNPSPGPSPDPGQFGFSVAGLDDGTIAVGAPGEFAAGEEDGRAYLYATTSASASLGGSEGWRLLAAPVAATAGTLLDGIYTQGIPGASSSDGGPSVYRYDESVAGNRDLGFMPLASMGEPAGAGRGLAVYVFEDDDPWTPGPQGGFPKTLTVGGLGFTGSSVPFPVSFTPTGSVQEDGWNLVGNPFDATLDWDAAGWVRSRLDNVIYVYDAIAGVYRTWNGSAGSLGDGLVASFQGFWVKANAVDPVLVAPAAARVLSPAPVPPLTAALGLVLEGELGGEAVSDAAFVSFHDEALPGLDPLDAYELVPFRATYAALYAEAENVALDVSAVAPSGATVEVPLGLAAVAGGSPASGEFTLVWPDLSRIPSGWGLSLLDTHDGTDVDLRAQASYTFVHDGTGTSLTAHAPDGPPVPTPLYAEAAESGGATPPRFLLRFTSTTVAAEDRPEDALRLGVRPNPASGRATLAVTSRAAGPARLAVYDALGREVAVVLDGVLPAGRHEIDLDTGRLAPGVYVVRGQAGGAVAAHTLTVVR